jgi:hypothetical protein
MVSQHVHHIWSPVPRSGFGFMPPCRGMMDECDDGEAREFGLPDEPIFVFADKTVCGNSS